MQKSSELNHGPLSGLRVLELGTMIGGPFATKIMGEFGADIIKVEPPKKGDPLRSWRHQYKGHSLWWLVQGRNKKSITLDLRKERGQEIARELAKNADILVENFRPGTLEKWGLGWEDLKKINPRLIMVRVSGYGQTGPYKDRPGFGSIGEAMGGIRYVTGYPDRPPVRVGISIGDSLAAMYAVIGSLMAIYERDVKGSGEGQLIDVALYEAVYSLMESLVPEYDVFGLKRERTGSSLPGVTPSNTYQTLDGKFIVIGANSDSIFHRLMLTLGREDLANDPILASGDGRGKPQNEEMLDRVIGEWVAKHSLEDALDRLNQAEVPASPIYSIEEMINDPQFIARKMFEEVKLADLESVKVPGIVPKFERTPGKIRWSGPEIGSHNDEIYRTELGITKEEIIKLEDEGVI
jgi:crotonobetainyl-CoA:carnitine CoA-transferase CaiB-like acyl-CoA transferase